MNLLYLVPGRVGGSEIYARQLVAEIARLRPDLRIITYCGREAVESLAREKWPTNVTIRSLRVRASIKPLRVLAEMVVLPILAARDRVDVLHSLGTTSPPVLSVPSVVTLLDLIYEHFPTTFSMPARAGLRALVGPGARRATRVVAISNTVRNDIVHRLRLRPERVVVVYPGLGLRPTGSWTPERLLRDRLGLGSGDIVLCVSAALAHKNLPRLIEAFALLADDLPSVMLVIVGHAGREQDRLCEAAKARGIDDRVTITGWISDEDLEGLYRAAACCVYPSLHEGFGMPVLEAMAREVPLACSNATALPEVAGDAAEFFDPCDTGAMASAVLKLLTDPERAQSLVARGRDRAQVFTWARSAKETLDIYDDVVA